MTRLEIRLLGRLEVVLDGVEVTDFTSDTTRALLGVLAAEPGRAWSRAVLAEMLWPGRPSGGALGNLRHALSVLRRCVGHAAILADRNNVALDASRDDVWVDVQEFERLVPAANEQSDTCEAWERTVALWRGSFLEGLDIAHAPEWEQWHLATGERWRRQLAEALRSLAGCCEQEGALERAVLVTQRLIDAEPWDEKAHRRLMRLLAADGESAKALAAYADLQGRLAAEFGTSPSPQTTALMVQIRAQQPSPSAGEAVVTYPAFLTKPAPSPRLPIFAGREGELDLLEAELKPVLDGRGRVALIAGESGTGKTMLAWEFMRRAAAKHGTLTASGRCNAYSGLGDPYLPFREALGLLSGDVESSLIAGRISPSQATRLWEMVPHAVRLVCERGPDLIGSMVNGGQLLERAEVAVPATACLGSLRAALVHTTATGPPTPGRQQPALFDEYVVVLGGIASVHPVVLMIDDVQWADRGSVALLWHLARRVEGLPVLLIVVYRPEGLSPDPAETILYELSAMATCTVELGPDRDFVDALLDSEANQLDENFRARFFSYTNGNALLAVEMVRGMQDRAELQRNEAGAWTIAKPPDWEHLPTRVEAVIAQRIGSLSANLRSDLIVAAVQGEEFIAEVTATVRADPDATERLSRASQSLNPLVEAVGVARIDGHLVARHRFRHILFQRYLYDRLDRARQMRLHEATGRALEALYGDHPDAPVVDIAHHFDAAGLNKPAIRFLYRAGLRALRMMANQEAIRIFDRALELLGELPKSSERDAQELELLVRLAACFDAARGWGEPGASRISNRIRTVSNQLPPSEAGTMGLLRLAGTHNVQGRIREGAEWSRKALNMAEELGNPTLQVLASFETGWSSMNLGDLEDGHEELRRSYENHQTDRDAALTYTYGIEPGPLALVWDGQTMWYRGFPERALELAERGIDLARRIDHPYTLCHALAIGATSLRWMCGLPAEALLAADEFGAIAAEHHFPFWSASASIYGGRAIGHLRDPAAGIALVAEGEAAWRALGIRLGMWIPAAAHAELDHASGRTQRALTTIEQAQTALATTNEPRGHLRLELLKGKYKRALGDPAASVVLLQAVDTARSMKARSIELLAATELALHFEAQDRLAEARAALEPVYTSFTEGFDTTALLDAAEVLDRL